eukprot:COSAG05_NODE_1730_length_4187_cov_126.370841_4_plen_90_part_00
MSGEYASAHAGEQYAALMRLRDHCIGLARVTAACRSHDLTCVFRGEINDRRDCLRFMKGTGGELTGLRLRFYRNNGILCRYVATGIRTG